MKYHSKIILLTLFLGFNALIAGPELARNFYRIENPNHYLLEQIEQMGGVVAAYKPGLYADVYLTKSLYDELLNKEIRIELHKESFTEILALDSLSSDHLIGKTYHNYDAVSFILDSLSTLYPQISRLESIGQTVQGREMWAMCISDNPAVEENEPEVKYISAMHGNEAITQELALCFIDTLLQNYYSDERIRKLVDSTEIWIIPNMNFDGTQNYSRFNTNGKDLNRDFPDREYDTENDPSGREVETVNMMNWSADHNFVLAANFHSGNLVVNYPWDKFIENQPGTEITPDDSTFKRISLSYSSNNAEMYNNPDFTNGITNGAYWYEIDGSMQDWSYNWLSCMEVTIEISEELHPPAEQIPLFFNQNRESMLSYIEQVHSGLKGIVIDSINGTPLAAKITVREIGKAVYCDPDFGDYYRLLEAGKYNILFEAQGYESTLVKDVQIAEGTVYQLDVLLKPKTNFVLSGAVYDSANGFLLNDAWIGYYQNDILKDSVRTDVDGGYSIILEEGSYLSKILKAGYFQKVDSVVVERDEIIDYRLVAILPTAIFGRVYLDDGGITEGTVVYCQGRTDTLIYPDYKIDSILAGHVYIYAYQSGYRTTVIDTFLHNGDTLQVDIWLYQGSNSFTTQFENDDGQFSGNNDWEYGAVGSGPGHTYSGTKLWGTVLDGNYESSAHLSSLTTPTLFLQGMVLPGVEFFQWYDLEENYDGCNLKISFDEGQSWQIVNPSPDYPLAELTKQFNNPLGGQPVYSGKNAKWERVAIDLTRFKEYPAFKLRFDLGVDDQKERPGWYIDDFRFFDANATSFKPDITERVLDKPYIRIFPNPANHTTNIQFRTLQNEDAVIEIFNVKGQIIRSVKLQSEDGELITWTWHGLDNSRRNIASGLYFIRLKLSSISITRKLVFIK